MMSPPPAGKTSRRDVPDKAAQIMGMGQSKSSREKGSRRLRDPYAVGDSDDQVMVDAPEDSAKDVPPVSISKERKRPSRSRRESTYMSGGLGEDPGATTDAPPHRQSEDVRFVSGAEDSGFERPPLVRRSTSTAKKPGILGGFLGALKPSNQRPPPPERKSSRAYESEDGMARRKRSVAQDDDRRLRREDRKVQEGRKASVADRSADVGPTTDVEDTEAREARRQERRERKRRELEEQEELIANRRAKEDSRRTRAREQQEQQAREEEEREVRKKEERRARREARRAEEERAAKEEEEQNRLREERRAARRAERERISQEEAAAAAAAAAPSRPKGDRRQSSYMDNPDDDEIRRARREERRQRRSVDLGEAGISKDRPRTSRRRSDYPADEPDRRATRTSRGAPPAPYRPVDDLRAQDLNSSGPPPPLGQAIKTGSDKTASWVAHINHEPPPPPPLTHTIIDAPVHFARDIAPDPLDEYETSAREFNQNRRKGRDAPSISMPPPPPPEENFDDAERQQRRRKRRDAVPPLSRDGVKSSDGSSHDRRRERVSSKNQPSQREDYVPRERDRDRAGMISPTANGLSRGNGWFRKFTGL